MRKLYLHGQYFRCRQCHKLAYASQSETAAARAGRRALRIRGDLGATGLKGSFPARPKGMWNRTYWRLFKEGSAAEQMVMADLLASLDRAPRTRRRRPRKALGLRWLGSTLRE